MPSDSLHFFRSWTSRGKLSADSDRVFCQVFIGMSRGGVSSTTDLMRNRAAKDAVRWCHLTHQVIAGASVHSREHKTSLVRCIPTFFPKRFINHSIII